MSMVFYGMVVNGPDVIAGDYEVIPADFGLMLNEGLRRGWLSYAGVKEKDLQRVRRSDVDQKFVMFDRGEMEFTVIAHAMQKLGALVVVIINNVHGPAIKMFADSEDTLADEINIPVVMLSKADGLGLRKILERSQVDCSLVSEMTDMFSWGNGVQGQLGLPGQKAYVSFGTPQCVVRGQSIRQIACGGNHSVCLLDIGLVFTWGHCEHGSLGHQKMCDKVPQPRKVEALAEVDAMAVACGSFHTMVATTEGDMYAFGWGEYGQLGLGTRESYAKPMKIERIGGKKVRNVACGYFHSLAICVNFKQPLKMTKEQMREQFEKEKVKAKKDAKHKKGSRSRRGDNDRRSKEDARDRMRASHRASMKRRSERGSRGGSKSAGSGSESMAFGEWKYTHVPKPEDEVRSVYTWGDGEHGQLGHGLAYTREYGKTMIKGGPAVKQQGKLRELTTLTTPRMVEALYGHRVVFMSAKGQHSMAMTERGEVFTWGDGGYGRLGHGTEDLANVPTQVEALQKTRIVSISAGQHHSAFVSDSGEVFTCGRGELGQLGQGEAAMDVCLTPKRIGLLSRRGVIKVVCSASATLVCTERGTVYTWGFNQGGRLGLGNEVVDEKVNSPMQLTALDGAEIRQIATGDAHNLALSDYYCADAVPERIDQGGASLVPQYEPPVTSMSQCCTIS